MFYYCFIKQCNISLFKYNNNRFFLLTAIRTERERNGIGIKINIKIKLKTTKIIEVEISQNTALIMPALPKIP